MSHHGSTPTFLAGDKVLHSIDLSMSPLSLQFSFHAPHGAKGVKVDAEDIRRGEGVLHGRYSIYPFQICSCSGFVLQNTVRHSTAFLIFLRKREKYSTQLNGAPLKYSTYVRSLNVPAKDSAALNSFHIYYSCNKSRTRTILDRI